MPLQNQKSKVKNKKKRHTYYYKERRRVIQEKGHYQCVWSYNKKDDRWYITVIDVMRPEVHRHFPAEQKGKALFILNYVAKSVIPRGVDTHTSDNIKYLMFGGEKPEKMWYNK